MDATFGISTEGKKTLLYRKFEYVKERGNVNGSTSWRCRYYQSLKCKARLLAHDSQATSGVVKQPSHKFRILNERVVRAVANFGQSEVLVYLRSIAHPSHS